MGRQRRVRQGTVDDCGDHHHTRPRQHGDSAQSRPPGPALSPQRRPLRGRRRRSTPQRRGESRIQSFVHLEPVRMVSRGHSLRQHMAQRPPAAHRAWPGRRQSQPPAHATEHRGADHRQHNDNAPRAGPMAGRASRVLPAAAGRLGGNGGPSANSPHHGHARRSQQPAGQHDTAPHPRRQALSAAAAGRCPVPHFRQSRRSGRRRFRPLRVAAGSIRDMDREGDD